MAQTGYTPILIYSSSTVSQAPSAGNLTNSTLGSELAINITDGKLFYKDNTNAVQVIAWKTTPTTAGGTGLTSYTAGDLLYYATGTTLSKLGIGASGNYLSSSGTAPQWSAPAALTKTDDTNVTLTLGGSASTALLNAASLTLGWTGTLAVSRGGTGTGTAFTAGSVVFAGASGVYSQNNGSFFWDNTNNRLGLGTTSPSRQLSVSGTTAYTRLTDTDTVKSGSVEAALEFYASDGQKAVVGFPGNDDFLLNVVDNVNLRFFTNNTERQRIFASGGVSIGNTTDPGATNLSVTGSATIQGLTVGKGASAVSTNSAFGLSALAAVTSGGLNTAVGYQAGDSITTGAENAIFGYGAGSAITSGASNTFIGTSAGFSAVSASNFVAVGNGAGYSATGDNNTAVGTSAANNLTSGTNNTAIGYAAGNSSSVINLTTQSNRVVIGDANVTNAYILVAWTVTSDARDKADVIDAPYGLNFVNELRPIAYKWDKRHNYDNGIPDGTHKELKTQLGFLAQDVIALEKKYGGVAKDLLIADDEIDESLKITETKMIPILVKALQELNAKFEAYVKEHP